MKQSQSNGVMLNAYPDSVGTKLQDLVKVLQKPAFKDVFSLFYVLPTFFNSDLDRGFSIIDYDLNKELVSKEDLEALEALNIKLKFDIVLNHLSVASPQFKDLLKNGNKSKYKDFFINWNQFWEGEGEKNQEGIVIPKQAYLNKLFMRKSGLPILKVPFPDGTEQPYWNTFYQKITPQKIEVTALASINILSENQKNNIVNLINQAIEQGKAIETLDLDVAPEVNTKIQNIVRQHSHFLGQMDVNAQSEMVWEFYDETLKKLSEFGCKVLRLDAFAYLHKEIGQTNFFNQPGTWNYLKRIENIAKKHQLEILPEIHAEYGLGLHEEVANKGYKVYDFFLPGLMLHTLEKQSSTALIQWIKEVIAKKYQTVHMLGCHDGIPVLDLKGKEVQGVYQKGLLEDSEIEEIMNIVMERGGRVKNLYDPSGKKISYYQVNATFFSALGENKSKMLLARAIQMFMPGIPQVWYLDLFMGTNDYKAVEKGGKDSHKEINRTTLSLVEVEQGLSDVYVQKQLELIRLRNTHPAFLGTVNVRQTVEHQLDIVWKHKDEYASLKVELKTFTANIEYTKEGENFDLKF
ncbi:alpha-amylase family glycosyl hydrolase [Ochrovirga pacifica]|uniref:alpha-amylase family glycosyl hydrolase n=1 Tax=Ochrovirga pacifica TaxID=1042376 RepID=UPI00025594D1|nr:alpha-amylase family glycosyl hydrolase [Ochrovirga pacifica]